MKFELDENQVKKYNEWYFKEIHDVHMNSNMGAIGGGITFLFTPNSIGVGITVKDAVTGKELNLTDYDSW